MLNGYMVKMKRLFEIPCENEVSECRGLIMYSEDDIMLDSLHCMSPTVFEQEWHSLNSACITFLSLFMMKTMQKV
jgi:hypothetical protein